jgi:hypothetical protein
MVSDDRKRSLRRETAVQTLLDLHKHGPAYRVAKIMVSTNTIIAYALLRCVAEHREAISPQVSFVTFLVQQRSHRMNILWFEIQKLFLSFLRSQFA